MAMTPAAPDGENGISTTTTGITVESESITPTPLDEPVPDQKNATAKEIYYRCYGVRPLRYPEEDLKRIPDVLSSFDDIIPGKGVAEGKKQEAVIFRKGYPDVTVCCVEIDWFSRGENRHELKFQTMWKKKLEK